MPRQNLQDTLDSPDGTLTVWGVLPDWVVEEGMTKFKLSWKQAILLTVVGTIAKVKPEGSPEILVKAAQIWMNKKQMSADLTAITLQEYYRVKAEDVIIQAEP